MEIYYHSMVGDLVRPLELRIRRILYHAAHPETFIFLVFSFSGIRTKEVAHLRVANPRPEILVEKPRAERREASIVWLPHPAFPVGREVIPLGQRAWQIVKGVQELRKVVSKRSTLRDMEPKASRVSNGHLLEEEVDSPSILCLKERVGNGVGQACHQSEVAALGATSSSPTKFFPLHLAVAKRQTSPKGNPQECRTTKQFLTLACSFFSRALAIGKERPACSMQWR